MTIKKMPVTKAEHDQMNKMVSEIADMLKKLKDPNKINTIIMGVICTFNINALMSAKSVGAIINKKDANKIFVEYMAEFKKNTEHLFNEIIEINKIYEE